MSQSVDIRNQQQKQEGRQHPHTPRKLRINPPSPEATRPTPRTNGSGPDRTGSPEATRSASGFTLPKRDLASTKEASRRMNILADSISPRKLPEDRFNSIVKQLNFASSVDGSGSRSSSGGTQSNDGQSVAGASEVGNNVSVSVNGGGKQTHKKHPRPRKLSVHHAPERVNGVNGVGGDG